MTLVDERQDFVGGCLTHAPDSVVYAGLDGGDFGGLVIIVTFVGRFWVLGISDGVHLHFSFAINGGPTVCVSGMWHTLTN